MAAGSRVPSSSSSTWSWASWLSPNAPPSWVTTCWRRPATTSVPAGASTRNATWLAIVPDGTNRAASLPVSSAKRRCRRSTVGSSPKPSSPTSASAMAAGMAGLGRVTVSLRRSTGGGVGVGIGPHGTVAAMDEHRAGASPAPAPPDPEALLTLAVGVTARAVELLLDGVRRDRVTVETKSTATDMVSEMDRASEALIVGALLAARPDDGIVAEEGSARAGTSGIRWVVDPLDGTTNYLYDHPGWAVSVAAEDAAGVVVGVV